MAATQDELIRAGREMRKYQKQFFKSAKDSPARKEALGYSKYWEGIFDALIAQAPEQQLDIFSVQNAEGEARDGD